MTKERIQKLMAHAGIASRRESERIIKQRRVTVNGKLATIGDKADPEQDTILVDGELLEMPDEYDYIILNKPSNVISDEDVGDNYEAARDLIPLQGHLYPVGRLDVDSEGLLLFTNDGDLANKLMHPRYDQPKTYHVTVAGHPNRKTLDHWRQGIKLDGKRTRRAEVRVLNKNRNSTELEIVMLEGRNRQIRRVAEALGHPLRRLVRVSLGPIEMGDLPLGGWRRLSDGEVTQLQAIRAQTRKPYKKRGQNKNKSGKSAKRGSQRK